MAPVIAQRHAEKKVIQCTSSDQQNITISASHVKVTGSSSRVVGDSSRSRPESFSVPYDILVVSVGAEVNSFNVPGVQEHAHFLKVRVSLSSLWA
jgi:NADH dehydrogenase FAD-containing subunit